MKMPNLAKTFELLAKNGKKGFYEVSSHTHTHTSTICITHNFNIYNTKPHNTHAHIHTECHNEQHKRTQSHNEQRTYIHMLYL